MNPRWLALGAMFAGLEYLASVMRDWAIDRAKRPMEDEDEPDPDDDEELD